MQVGRRARHLIRFLDNLFAYYTVEDRRYLHFARATDTDVTVMYIDERWGA